MKPALCLCAQLVPRATRTAVRVVVHESELWKSTNSGRLLPLLLGNATLVPYGNGRPDLPPELWPANTRPVVLFPLEGAPTVDTVVRNEDPNDVGANDTTDASSNGTKDSLSVGHDRRPFTLIVLDGTWHQANRVRKRFHHLRVPFVRLPDTDEPSLYRLRRGHFGSSLSTLEAAARAVAILEGDPTVAEHLVDGFRRMQDRTLWLRGALAADDVYGGLPAGVQRHAVSAGASSSTSPAGNRAGPPTATGDG
jgi:DTW domain-containing protein YfiP